ASKLLTGRAPKVVQAVYFFPIGVQTGLKSVTVAGNPSYNVDPNADDFYKRLVELRKEKSQETVSEENQSDVAQQALKILVNATSYGIFVERIVNEQKSPKQVTCYGSADKPFTTLVNNIEESGPFFHPLLGSLTTGGARLMLAIAERLAADQGIGWAFCDTDSMALAKPSEMP